MIEHAKDVEVGGRKSRIGSDVYVPFKFATAPDIDLTTRLGLVILQLSMDTPRIHTTKYTSSRRDPPDLDIALPRRSVGHDSPR